MCKFLCRKSKICPTTYSIRNSKRIMG